MAVPGFGHLAAWLISMNFYWQNVQPFHSKIQDQQQRIEDAQSVRKYRQMHQNRDVIFDALIVCFDFSKLF